MLNTNVESKNVINISGILSELEVVESNTRDGRAYVRATAKIRADQEVDGKLIENEIPVKMFSMRNKSDGSLNKVYDRIVGYKELYTSAGAAEDISQASQVSISCKIEENSYIGKSGNVVNAYQFTGSFLNNKREMDEEGATFELQGVIGNITEELDKDGNETGRLKVSFIVIGYGGKAHVIELIATDSKRAYIENNWNKGDTVIAAGKIVSSFKTIVTYEEQGFGDPIKRTRTEGRRELLITGGSPCGADEDSSYDADSIKLALQERKANLEKMKEESKNKTINRPVANSNFDF